MSRQVWAFIACLVALAFSAASFAATRWTVSIAFAFVGVALWLLARRWNRLDPKPFPHELSLVLRLPRPFQSPARVIDLLDPHTGDRVLEIGPGIGTHAIPLASHLSPGGWLDVLDVQREMVEQVRREARHAGVPNIRPVQADAGRLPYRDAAFDAAYMIGTLGEIPDRDGALRELHRVLRPAGRLVVGEVFVDPDFVSLRDLKARAHEAGFAFHSKAGNLLAYVARFVRAAEGVVEDGLAKFDPTNLTLSVSPSRIGTASVAGNARPLVVK